MRATTAAKNPATEQSNISAPVELDRLRRRQAGCTDPPNPHAGRRPYASVPHGPAVQRSTWSPTCGGTGPPLVPRTSADSTDRRQSHRLWSHVPPSRTTSSPWDSTAVPCFVPSAGFPAIRHSIPQRAFRPSRRTSARRCDDSCRSRAVPRARRSVGYPRRSGREIPAPWTSRRRAPARREPQRCQIRRLGERQLHRCVVERRNRAEERDAELRDLLEDVKRERVLSLGDFKNSVPPASSVGRARVSDPWAWLSGATQSVRSTAPSPSNRM